jgi:hypothetical protein
MRHGGVSNSILATKQTRVFNRPVYPDGVRIADGLYRLSKGWSAAISGAAAEKPTDAEEERRLFQPHEGGCDMQRFSPTALSVMFTLLFRNVQKLLPVKHSAAETNSRRFDAVFGPRFASRPS